MISHKKRKNAFLFRFFQLYDHLDCTPKEGRTIVSDADFFHFSGCSGGVKSLNCKAKGAHDDIINLHGTLFERIPSRAILCTTRKDVVISNQGIPHSVMT